MYKKFLCAAIMAAPLMCQQRPQNSLTPYWELGNEEITDMLGQDYPLESLIPAWALEKEEKLLLHKKNSRLFQNANHHLQMIR